MLPLTAPVCRWKAKRNRAVAAAVRLPLFFAARKTQVPGVARSPNGHLSLEAVLHFWLKALPVAF
jgi:hypothetical protein